MQNQVALPTDLQRLITAVAAVNNPTDDAGDRSSNPSPTIARVRCCDMCEYVLTQRSRLELPTARSTPTLHPFSYAPLDRRHPPLHLAAESQQCMHEWMEALGSVCSQTTVITSSAIVMDDKLTNIVNNVVAGSAPKSLTTGSFLPTSANGASVYKEGWLMKEDGEQSKLFKRHFCILSNGRLHFLDPSLRKTLKLSSTTVIKRLDDHVNISASGWGSDQSDNVGARDTLHDPNRWPTAFVFSIEQTRTEQTTGAVSTSNANSDPSILTFGARSEEERDLWIQTLQRDVEALTPHTNEAHHTTDTVQENEVKSQQQAHARIRSASTPTLAPSTKVHLHPYIPTNGANPSTDSNRDGVSLHPSAPNAGRIATVSSSLPHHQSSRLCQVDSHADNFALEKVKEEEQ